MSFSSSHFSLLSIAWTLVSLLSSGLLITSSILLMRERHLSSWMMLGGSSISVVALVAHRILPVFLSYREMNSLMLNLVLSSVSVLANLIFCIGLLFFVLHRRGLANRITELEAILNSRD